MLKTWIAVLAVVALLFSLSVAALQLDFPGMRYKTAGVVTKRAGDYAPDVDGTSDDGLYALSVTPLCLTEDLGTNGGLEAYRASLAQKAEISNRINKKNNKTLVKKKILRNKAFMQFEAQKRRGTVMTNNGNSAARPASGTAYVYSDDGKTVYEIKTGKKR